MKSATLASLLATLRAQHGLTLRELGRQAGIAHTTLGRWEKGTHLPCLPELEVVLTTLNVAPHQRQQALALLDAPRALAITRQETARYAPGFVEAVGGMPGEGALLRAMRLRAGKTLENAARAVGVTKGTLSRWEHSEARPDMEHLHTLCYVLGATEEEVAILTCAGGIASSLPQTANAEQIATLAAVLQWEPWKLPAGLEELVCIGLEARAWQLIPQQPEVQQVLFAHYYWRMQTLYNTGRLGQVRLYLQRVLALTDILPTIIPIAPPGYEAVTLQTREAHNRALIYQAALVRRSGKIGNRQVASRLAREWQNAHNAYYRAWMMSEAATILVKAGEIETAQDWSRQACEVADIGEDWTEALFRRRDYADIMGQSGESERALETLETTTALNDYHPDCRARYHLRRTEIYRNLHQSAQAQEELMQARSLMQTLKLTYLQPQIESLERRF